MNLFVGQCMDSRHKNHKDSFVFLLFTFETKEKYMKYCLVCSRGKETSVIVVILVI